MGCSEADSRMSVWTSEADFRRTFDGFPGFLALHPGLINGLFEHSPDRVEPFRTTPIREKHTKLAAFPCLAHIIARERLLMVLVLGGAFSAWLFSVPVPRFIPQVSLFRRIAMAPTSTLLKWIDRPRALV